MHLGYKNRRVDFHWVSLTRSYRRFVSSTSTVLEIGASTIESTRELSVYCNELIGLELLPERTPADFDNVRYVTGDWQTLTRYLEPDTIDVAIASHVMEHIPDDLRALNELFTVLKPGGVALLSTPNRKRLTRAIIELYGGEREFPWWEHVREYTEEDLIALVESSMFNNYTVLPLVFGLHGGPIFFYLEKVPDAFRKYANFWEVQLFKE
jgi:SAM-dependent methyltransferase